MRGFWAKYPSRDRGEELRMTMPFNKIGTLRVCDFYTCNYDTTGLAFRAAFDAADKSSDHKELCAYVGSMLSAVSNSLKHSVMEALLDVGIKPCIVSLPSWHIPYMIYNDQTQFRQMDWPLILTNFACMVIFIFITNNSEEDFKSFMSSCVDQLQKRLVVEPGVDQYDVPFNFNKANAIRSMLGASLTLREKLIQFITGNMNEEHDAKMGTVCQYLFDVLSWSRMDELVLLNETLVIPDSPVLREPQHLKEAGKLREACAAVESHPYPQFFMHLASKKDLMKVDLSRFPNLIDIAKKTKLETREQPKKKKVKLERQ